MSATALSNPSRVGPAPELPLILEPGDDADLGALLSWIQANRDSLDEQILNHGAVLLRGEQRSADGPDLGRALARHLLDERGGSALLELV